MKNGVKITTLSAMIEAALTQTFNRNHTRFGDAVRAYAKTMCMARAPDLAERLLDDVAHEAIVNLFVAGPKMLETTKPLKMLRHAVLGAIRKVRADHAPPGQRTRRYRDEPRDRIAAGDTDRIPGAAALEAATTRVGDYAMIEVDSFACPAARLATIEAEQRVEIATVLAKAPPNIAEALRLVHLDAWTMNEAAASMNLSRFALHRRVESFCTTVRLAA